MDFLATAIQAARMVGVVHKKYFQTAMVVEAKTSHFDRVTIADRQAEQTAVDFIKSRYPGHNILAEEGQYPKQISDYTWIIDPLDGTNNFSCGLPIFCVSIALAQREKVICAVIYDALRDELFRAESGQGAFLNDKPIEVSKASLLSESLLITGFYYDRGEEMVKCLEKIKMFFFNNIIGIRRLGAAALDLAYVACGRASGYWEFLLSPWDFAAGKLIVEEAGGRVTNLNSEPVDVYRPSYVVASNGRIHQTMLSILKS